jgi:hypothetical protein
MRIGINKALEEKPDVIIVMTDGGTPWPAEPLKRTKLIVGLVGWKEDTAPDWAHTIEIGEVT